MKSLIVFLTLISGLAQAQETLISPVTPPVFAKLEMTDVSRNMTAVNSRFYLVNAASVSFTNKNLHLTLNKSMPLCPPGRMCAMMMPAPVQIDLSIIKVSRTACSVKYLAVTPLQAAERVLSETSMLPRSVE